LGVIRVINKLQNMIKSNPATLEESKTKFEEYKQTEPYKKWEKEHEKRENDDPITNDPDPEGWALYLKAIETPDAVILDYASKVAKDTPENVDMQSKATRMFKGKND